MNVRAPQSFRILLVEDSPTDALMVREALDAIEHPIQLDVAEDGVSAMRYLKFSRDHATTLGSANSPDLILLDLNLPGKDGRELLSEIKSDPQLKVIPVVVLTSSKADDDVMQAYALHANSYVTKPADFEAFCNVVRTIEAFWFTTVRLPGVTEDRL
jgi:two-component system, chemotaxis family, response regulator Rcp1